MYHNRNKLLRAAVWLRVISWYFLFVGVIGSIIFLKTFLDSYPSLPFSVGNSRLFQPPDWTDWGNIGVLFFQQIANPILYFLMYQGLASTIHFLLAYYHRKSAIS